MKSIFVLFFVSLLAVSVLAAFFPSTDYAGKYLNTITNATELRVLINAQEANAALAALAADPNLYQLTNGNVTIWGTVSTSSVPALSVGTLTATEGKFTKNGPVYTEYDNTASVGDTKVSVGMLGHPEANLSFNMDYATATHRFYDTNYNAMWLALGSTAWALQFAPATDMVGDVWYGTGTNYLIWGSTNGTVVLDSDLATIAAGGYTAKLVVPRNSVAGYSSIAGDYDLVLEGAPVKGTSGLVYLNPYNTGRIVMALGRGGVGFHTINDPGTNTVLFAGNVEVRRAERAYTLYENTASVGDVKVEVGMIGSPEADLAFNLDYTNSVHRLHDTNYNAIWLAINNTSWSIPFAYATNGTGNVWYGSGTNYLIWGGTNGSVILNSDLSSINTGGYDANLTVPRKTNMPSITGVTDLIIDGAKTKGTNGTVYMNAYNTGRVILALGGGGVGFHTITDPGTNTVAFGGDIKVGTQLGISTTLDVLVGPAAAPTTNRLVYVSGVLVSNIVSFYP